MSVVVRMRHALPDDPALDEFESGDREVDHYFRTRAWWKGSKGKASPPTFQFVTGSDDSVVGYAAVAWKTAPHPWDSSLEFARYLVVYAFGVNAEYHGAEIDGAGGITYALAMLEMLISEAWSAVDCRGLSLWVRTANTRAIAFYRKAGFEADPKGPVARDKKGSAHLTMRLHF